MSRQVQDYFWILSGPGSLLVALILLLFRSSQLIQRPVWVFGLVISVCIACLITYLTLQEFLKKEDLLEALKREKEREVASIRSTLDEAREMYQKKVRKLEEVIAKLEGEYQATLMQYEKACHASEIEKATISALQISLNDSLDNLRTAHQLNYLQTEHFAKIPHNLASQHKQLREQFDEKALVLDQTRRRLFSLEGQLFIARKELIDKGLDADESLELLQEELVQLVLENENLESEIMKLEEVISEILKPKTRRKSSSSSKAEQTLELQFGPVILD